MSRQDGMENGAEKAAKGERNPSVGAYRRQTWRPPALRSLESLAGGISRRIGGFVARARRLLAWRERRTVRIGAWRGWAPLPLAFLAEGLTTNAGAERPPGAWLAQPSAPSHRGHTGTDQTRVPTGSDLYRGAPAPGLAPSRPMLAVPAIPGRDLEPLLPSKFRFPIGQHPPPLRLALSVSLTPRKEVSREFWHSPVLGRFQEKPGRHRAEPAEQPPTGPLEMEMEGLRQPATSRTEDRTPTLRTERRGVIEKLMATTGAPKPITDLSLRPLSREEFLVATQPIWDANRADRPAEESSTAPTSQPPAAPPLDINAVTERVYKKLLRRQQIERERRGLS